MIANYMNNGSRDANTLILAERLLRYQKKRSPEMKEYQIFYRSRKAISRQRRRKWHWLEVLNSLKEAEIQLDQMERMHDSDGAFEYKIIEMVEGRSWTYTWG